MLLSTVQGSAELPECSLPISPRTWTSHPLYLCKDCPACCLQGPIWGAWGASPKGRHDLDRAKFLGGPFFCPEALTLQFLPAHLLPRSCLHLSQNKIHQRSSVFKEVGVRWQPVQQLGRILSSGGSVTSRKRLPSPSQQSITHSALVHSEGLWSSWCWRCVDPGSLSSQDGCLPPTPVLGISPSV